MDWKGAVIAAALVVLMILGGMPSAVLWPESPVAQTNPPSVHIAHP